MRPILTLIFALALSIASQSAVAQSELIDGQVTKVDQSAGKITIRHGPMLECNGSPRGQQARRDRKALRAWQVPKGRKVSRDLLGPEVLPGPRDRLVLRAPARLWTGA